MTHHAEAGVKPLFGIGVSGGNRSDLGDARIVVDPRRRDAGTGIPVADNPGHITIDQTLSDGYRGTWVRLIVLRQQFERDCFAADGGVLLIDVVNGQLRPVFQIFTDTGRRAG